MPIPSRSRASPCESARASPSDLPHGGLVHHAPGRHAPSLRKECTIPAVAMHHHPRSSCTLGAAYAAPRYAIPTMKSASGTSPPGCWSSWRRFTAPAPTTCWASPMNPPPIPAPEKSRTHKHAPPGANGIWGRWRSRNYLRFFPGRPEGFCRFRGEEGAPLAWDLPARWGALAGAECPSRWGRSGRSRHWGP